MHFSKGRRRFCWPNYKVGWLFWSLYPVEVPPKTSLARQHAGRKSVCVGLDVAVGQQHIMETSTFLLEESSKKHTGTFFVWKFLALILLF